MPVNHRAVRRDNEFGGFVYLGQFEDTGCGAVVYVAALTEYLPHEPVAGTVGKGAEFDLRVIGADELVAGAGDEGGAYEFA